MSNLPPLTMYKYPIRLETKFIEIPIDIGYDSVQGWLCKECETRYEQSKFDFEKPNYCPNCGRKIKP